MIAKLKISSNKLGQERAVLFANNMFHTILAIYYMIGTSVMKKIYVVIPNWNGSDLIEACLLSLQGQTQKHTIVVVDNGSVDDSVAIIQTKFPDVKLLRLEKNTGFSGGVNVGIKHALQNGAELIALFNNDAVAKKDWLQKLVAVMKTNSKAGIVTSKLLLMDKVHIDSTGDFYSIWAKPFPRGRNQLDVGQYDQPEEVFGASGGASLYRAELFKQIGLFDEKFFAYLEDVDMSFRTQLAGWKVLYEPTAIAYHHLSATSSRLGSFSRYHFIKNFYLLYTKNMPTKLYWKYILLFKFQSVRLAASALLRGGGWVYFTAWLKAVSLIPHIIHERRRIQNTRKVSVGYIDSILYKKRPPRIPKIS